MISESDINRSVNNSIRSLFQMIAVLRDSDGACAVIDHDKSLENIAVLDPAELSFSKLRKKLVRNIHPEDRDMFREFTNRDRFVERLREKVHLSMECRIRYADRKYHWSEVVLCNTTEADSTEGDDCLFMIRDINERKTRELKREAEERAVFTNLQDRYDALFEENMTDQQTGCYNRKGMNYYSDIVINEAKKKSRHLFVCVADLNGLKYLNDTFGHAAGDEAIAAIATELRNSAPSGSKVVRIGGDEFMLFAALDPDSKEPDDFAEKVDAGVKAYNEAHDNPFDVGVSYGYVLLPPKENMTVLDEYVEMADERMYEMKMQRDEHRRE